MNWNRINVWTHTFYTLVHSLHISKQINFGNLDYLDNSFRDANEWIQPDFSFSSVLLDHESGGKTLTFRRDPNSYFPEVSKQVINMLAQDLVVIFDEMMADILIERGVSAGGFPKSKIEKLTVYLDPKYTWASNGCTEFVAVRNVLAHNSGTWNKKSINYVKAFMDPPPKEGDKLTIGFSALFAYRKAIRTFLNEVKMPNK